MLPLLPVYISYFAGNTGKKRSGAVGAIAFMLGFTLIFVTLGVFAGTVGVFLKKYGTVLNIVCGAVVILFGIAYLTGAGLPFLKGMKAVKDVPRGFFSTMVFGMIYSLNLTPCVGTFLGSALMLASASQGVLKGALLLFFYSLGLGLPFVLSAVFLTRLKSAFGFIKNHYRVVNIICGGFLIVVGVLIMTGLMSKAMLLLA